MSKQAKVLTFLAIGGGAVALLAAKSASAEVITNEPGQTDQKLQVKNLLEEAKKEESPEPLIQIAKKIQDAGFPHTARTVVDKAVSPLSDQRAKAVILREVANEQKKIGKQLSDSELKKVKMGVVGRVLKIRKQREASSKKAVEILTPYLEKVAIKWAAKQKAPKERIKAWMSVMKEGRTRNAPFMDQVRKEAEIQKSSGKEETDVIRLAMTYGWQGESLTKWLNAIKISGRQGRSSKTKLSSDHVAMYRLARKSGWSDQQARALFDEIKKLSGNKYEKNVLRNTFVDLAKKLSASTPDELASIKFLLNSGLTIENTVNLYKYVKNGPSGGNKKGAVKESVDISKSPIEGIKNSEWKEFVKRSKVANSQAKTDKNYFGMFLYGWRRLQDLGVAENVKRIQKNGKTVWSGEWKKPYSESAFLGSEQLQYKIFVKDIKDLISKFEKIRSSGRNLLQPIEIGGKKITISASGLLTVAHLAGLNGAINWVESAEERKKFPDTTKMFLKTNGIF